MKVLDEEINLKEEIPEFMDEITDDFTSIINNFVETVIKGVSIFLICLLCILIVITTPIWILPRYLYKRCKKDRYGNKNS